MSHGKAYREGRSRIDREHAYSPLEAIRLLKELPAAKFDETVEAHFRLGLNVGPGGKMPNPKAGTVTFDVGKAVEDAKGGKLEYRTDRGANVHVTVGKKSFTEQQLLENYAVVVEEIVRAKPAAAKGRYIRS